MDSENRVMTGCLAVVSCLLSACSTTAYYRIERADWEHLRTLPIEERAALVIPAENGGGDPVGLRAASIGALVARPELGDDPRFAVVQSTAPSGTKTTALICIIAGAVTASIGATLSLRALRYDSGGDAIAGYTLFGLGMASLAAGGASAIAAEVMSNPQEVALPPKKAATPPPMSPGRGLIVGWSVSF